MTVRLFLCCLICTLFFQVSSGSALENMDLPINLQFKLLIKAATFDRSQKEKDAKTLRVGVLYSSEEGSEQVARNVFELFGGNRTKVRQYVLELVPIEVESSIQLLADTAKNEIHAYYIAPGNQGHLLEILNTSQQLQMLTMTGIPDYVHQGVTLGVANNGSRPEFLYNYHTAQQNGVDFHSNFLRLVRVIK